MERSDYFTLTIHDAETITDIAPSTGTDEASATYTRGKNADTTKDPKVGDKIFKQAIKTYTDDGYDSYNLYWLVNWTPLLYCNYVYAIMMTVLVIVMIIRHHENIGRLKAGTERKIKWMKSKE